MLKRHYLRKFNFIYYIKKLMEEKVKEIQALTTKVNSLNLTFN